MKPPPASPFLSLQSAFGPMPAYCALLGLALLAGTSLVSGLQMQAPVLMLAPVLLCAAAVVSSRPLIALMAASVLALSALLHSRSLGEASADMAALWGQWWMLTASQLCALAAGWGIGRLIERRLRFMAQHLPGGAVDASGLPEIPVALAIHRDGVVQQANWAAARLLGCTDRQEAVGQRLNLQNLPSIDGTAQDLQQLRTADGRLVSVSRSQQWTRHAGLPSELVVLHDEQPRLQAEDSARAARSTLSALIEGHPCAMVLSDLQTTRVLLANKAFAEAIGLNEGDIKGTTTRALGIWTDEQQRDRIIEGVRSGLRTLEEVIAIRRRDGRVRHFRARMSRIRIEDRPALLTVAYDITEQHSRQTELESVLALTRSAMLLVREGRITQASRAAARLLGTETAELIGRPASHALGGRQPLVDLEESRRQLVEGSAARPVESVRTIRLDGGGSLSLRVTGQALDRASLGDAESSVWLLEPLTATEPLPTAEPLATAEPKARDTDPVSTAFDPAAA